MRQRDYARTRIKIMMETSRNARQSWMRNVREAETGAQSAPAGRHLLGVLRTAELGHVAEPDAFQAVAQMARPLRETLLGMGPGFASRRRQAAGRSASKREVPVSARGTPLVQASSRVRFMAAAVNRCCSWVFPSPR